jgi:hypothetical protein
MPRCDTMGLSMASPQWDLENIWSERVRAARERYRDASRAFQDIWDEHFEIHLSTDPTHAIQHARQVESAALSEYVRVLKIFTDLVLHGKTPDEDGH